MNTIEFDISEYDDFPFLDFFTKSMVHLLIGKYPIYIVSAMKPLI